MPKTFIGEEGFFFLRAESLCTGPAITCEPEDTVVAVATRMSESNISGMVVVERDLPVGIISVRDLRDLIARTGGQFNGYLARDIMKTPLVTIRRQDYVFDVVFKMVRHGIHRVVILDDDQRLAGVVTDTDLLGLQTRSPLYLTREIETAADIELLKGINTRILQAVDSAARSGADARSLVKLISHFNDVFTLRIISLMESEEGIVLPQGAAFLILGSEGRGEQTLRTDQDSALVYVDAFPEQRMAELHRFSNRLVDALEQVGIPRCPGNTMANNPEWCRSLSSWKKRLDHWISVPNPENMVNFSMFQDFRALHGDVSLEAALHEHVYSSIQRHNLYLPYMARHIEQFGSPIGLFGRIRVEKKGENRGLVDIKRCGTFILTEGISLMALEQNVYDGTTWDKIEFLAKNGILSPSDAAILDDSFTYLMRLRLTRQLRALAEGTELTNYLDPQMMSAKEREHLRAALQGVSILLKILRVRYKLDAIPG